MKRFSVVLCAVLLVFGSVGALEATEYCYIEFPHGNASFADELVSYSVGSYLEAPYNDPEKALGAPECSGGRMYKRAASLGNYGTLVLKFTNNSLTTSGNEAADLWVFEAGRGIEEVFVFISQNGTDWIPVGIVGEGTKGVDIDAFIGKGVVPGARYSYVKLEDIGHTYSKEAWAGADINAVGAISSAPPVDTSRISK